MLSRNGIFSKDKKRSVLPGTVKKAEATFDLTFTYGFALVTAGEEKAIEAQVPDLAEALWKLQVSDSPAIEIGKKQFTVFDKTIKHTLKQSLTLLNLQNLCDLHEKDYKKAQSKLQENAGLAQAEAGMHGSKTAIVYCFKLEIKDGLGHSCSFADFDEMREHIQNQLTPSVKPAKRSRRQ